MSQPVKLSDKLVLDARLMGGHIERSIAGQIEYWANLGRAIEKVLNVEQAVALCQAANARPVSDCLKSVDSLEGRTRVSDYLKTRSFPHYEPYEKDPKLLLRTDENGKTTIGRFVDREFKIVRVKNSSK